MTIFIKNFSLPTLPLNKYSHWWLKLGRLPVINISTNRWTETVNSLYLFPIFTCIFLHTPKIRVFFPIKRNLPYGNTFHQNHHLRLQRWASRRISVAAARPPGRLWSLLQSTATVAGGNHVHHNSHGAEPYPNYLPCPNTDYYNAPPLNRSPTHDFHYSLETRAYQPPPRWIFYRKGQIRHYNGTLCISLILE